MALQMGNWGEVTPRNEVITLLTIGIGPPCRCFFFIFDVHNPQFHEEGTMQCMQRLKGCMFFFRTFKLKI